MSIQAEVVVAPSAVGTGAIRGNFRFKAERGNFPSMLLSCESSDVGRLVAVKFFNITTSSFVLSDECPFTVLVVDVETTILRRPIPRLEIGKPRDDEVVVLESSIGLEITLGELLTELLKECRRGAPLDERIRIGEYGDTV